MAAAVEALYVVLEREGAILPRQEGFSGVYVFFSPINFVIPPMGAVMLSLRLRVCIPPGYFGRFLALTDVNQPDVFTESYIMTPDMTEELSVVLFNHGDQFFYGHAGMAVVRLMLIRVVFPVLALRRDLRDRGIFVNVPLLNLIQVCEEPEFLQSVGIVYLLLRQKPALPYWRIIRCCPNVTL
ncbi:20 kDa protein [Human adenovirus 1]|uniref:20 kDa protein n=1 Tax=Human mastadenovirus C TaxID=129951 RepID=A0A481ZKJ8_9ADEN|nr:20 kDa protein [Human mastadenovirus C]WOR02062.1 20 kDa protein [Human adenovirus 1]WOR02183.1 20 kDa protein [Human adenovirus 1]WOR02204.1 20 kDa protein [Human adenovirus 1]WOR02210.1 20 kDa protein [Human adenovirus 1]